MKSLEFFASSWPECWLCFSQRELQIHHICGRRGMDPHDPRNLFRACRFCHELYHSGSRTERYVGLEHILYAKRHHDPDNYDPQYLASIRGRKHLGVEPMVPDWWPYYVSFTLFTRPVPQPRPRITRRGPPRAYVPADHPVHAFRRAVTDAAASSGACATTRPVTLSVTSVFARPKSHWRKGVLKESSPALPRCDVDNLAKGVMDALIGVAYQDDTQVMSIWSKKCYGTEDHVIVRLQHAE